MEDAGQSERRYNSPLRQRQQEMTREAILTAVGDLLCESGVLNLTVQNVADRAGISYGSVYRHFPTREALLEGLHEWAAPLTAEIWATEPVTLDSLPERAARLARIFDLHRSKVQAITAADAALGYHPEDRRRRDERLRAVIAAELPHLTSDEIRVGAAQIMGIMTAQNWVAMRNRYGLSADEAALAISSAMRTLIAELKRIK